MHPEPIRHHYIPQFILRNFCDNRNQLYYYDKQTKCISVKDTRDVFMERNLYRDEVNHSTNPVEIEKDLATYEQEIAPIIKNKFLTERDIFITPEENEKIMLFFLIMGFRSLNAKHGFEDWELPDEDPLTMWKRNLGHIVKCRSFEEVMNHPSVDNGMKIFACRDAIGYFGKYISVVEANDENAFLISDAYPVTIDGWLQNGIPLNLYYIFPISFKRILLMVHNGAQCAPREFLDLREFLLQPPVQKEENLLRLRVRKLCTDEVNYINEVVFKNAREGVAFYSKSMPIAISEQ